MQKSILDLGGAGNCLFEALQTGPAAPRINYALCAGWWLGWRRGLGGRSSCGWIGWSALTGWNPHVLSAGGALEISDRHSPELLIPAP